MLALPQPAQPTDTILSLQLAEALVRILELLPATYLPRDEWRAHADDPNIKEQVKEAAALMDVAEQLQLNHDLCDALKRAFEEAKQKRRRPGPRGPRRPRNVIDAKGKETIMTTSDIITLEVMKGLLKPETFTPREDRQIAEHTHSFARDQGRLIITIRPEEGEGWSEVMAALQTLGSECVDTFTAAIAMALEVNGIEHIRTPFLINPDDILAVCGKKRTNRSSYTAGQRAEVIKHLKTLSQARIIATFPGKRRKRNGVSIESTTIRVEGALIDLLSFKIGEYSTITGEELWEKRSISIGEWITMAPGLNNQTAIMLRQILAYSAKNERYQKEIGRYLTFMFRVNNHKQGGIFECSMKTLLEGAGIKVPREIGKFREAIEYALTCLKQDDVIGEYAQVVDACPREVQDAVREHARGWWDLYAMMKWRFTPPQYARTQYLRLLRAPKEETA